MPSRTDQSHPDSNFGVALAGKIERSAFGRPRSSPKRLLLALLVTAVCLDLMSACKTAPAHREKTTPVAAPVQLEPLDASVGRVASVNLPLRFVVLDYSLSRAPQPGDHLELRRAGSVIGELKTGYHSRESSVIADVVSGTPAVGDEARPLRP